MYRMYDILEIEKTGFATCNVQMPDCAIPKFSDDAEFPKSEIFAVRLPNYVAAIYDSLKFSKRFNI